MIKEVLRTGIFTDANGKKVEITENTLDKLVTNFNSETSVNSEGQRVPLFLGHPQDESTAPAHGWIKRIFRTGPVLSAEFDKLTENADKAIKNFSFRDVSVSIWKNILQHIGLTNTPAVAGLADFEFKNTHKDESQLLTFVEPQKGDNMSEKEIQLASEKKDLEVKLTALESEKSEALELNTTLTAEKEALEAEKAELTKGKEEAEAKNAELETKIQDEAVAAELAKDTSFVEKLVEDGKLKPADKDATIANLSKFPNEKIEGLEKTPKEMHKDALLSKGKELEEGEKFADGEKPAAGESKIEKLVNQKMKAEKLTHNVALGIVLNENPELNNGGK